MATVSFVPPADAASPTANERTPVALARCPMACARSAVAEDRQPKAVAAVPSATAWPPTAVVDVPFALACVPTAVASSPVASESTPHSSAVISVPPSLHSGVSSAKAGEDPNMARPRAPIEIVLKNDRVGRINYSLYIKLSRNAASVTLWRAVLVH